MVPCKIYECYYSSKTCKNSTWHKTENSFYFSCIKIPCHIIYRIVVFLFIVQSQNHHHCNQGLTKKNIDLGPLSLLHNPWCCKSMAHSKLSSSSFYLQVPCSKVLHSPEKLSHCEYLRSYHIHLLSLRKTPKEKSHKWF